MSIQSEINRINAAKAAILAALTEKGVDTTGAGLADIAGLVSAIEAGGAAEVEIMTFTPAVTGVSDGILVGRNVAGSIIAPKFAMCMSNSYPKKSDEPNGEVPFAISLITDYRKDGSQRVVTTYYKVGTTTSLEVAISKVSINYASTPYSANPLTFVYSNNGPVINLCVSSGGTRGFRVGVEYTIILFY